jgi:putative component of membrane protein insertase Oxa1/YidC/SpoIIIJ protein YidD
MELILEKLRSMSSNNFQTLVRQTAVNSVSLYQKHLSPRKGFSCPHRLLYQGASCSDYTKELFANQRLIDVVPMSFARFRDCALASRTLKSQRSQGGCIVIPCCIPF